MCMRTYVCPQAPQSVIMTTAPCTAPPSTWSLPFLQDKQGYITCLANGLVLDVDTRQPHTSQGRLCLYRKWGGKNQQWGCVQDLQGSCTLKSKFNGRVLDADTQRAGGVMVYPQHGLANQQWQWQWV